MHKTLDSSMFRKDDVVINRFEISHVDLHDHEFIEVAYIAGGEGTQIINGQTMHVSAGDYFVIDRGTVHEFRDGSPMTIYNCIFTPRFVDTAMAECPDFASVTQHYLFPVLRLRGGALPRDHTFHADRRVDALFREMLWEYQNEQPGYLQVLQADVRKLLLLSLRQVAQETPTMNSGMDQTYYQVVRYLCYHYADPVRLEDLAHMACVSPEHFSRQFKRFTGKTVTELLQELRINEAARLLLQTENRVEEIAEEVGYHDAHYFAALFARIKGESPAGYRRNHPRRSE